MNKNYMASISLMILSHSLAHADVAAIQTITGGSPTYGAGQTAGWDFRVDNDITVTKLGFYAAGLISPSTEVGLWTSNGTLLGEVTVVPGSVENGFYYTTLASSISLTAGQDYILGAYFGFGTHFGNGDFGVGGATSVGTSPDVTYLHNAYSSSAGVLTAPTSTFAPDELGYFGPNFQYVPTSLAPTPVPEPSTYAAGGLLLLTLGVSFFSSMRKKSAAPSPA